ncbi:hypothetical protein QE410_000196 [Microbacterium sp. SORGH_AS 1204]|uniref:hypothetical protein n=1 Tax=Microbacterium sp. SORGH_AS_1204 TaxID=3041785 RepID=UPI00278D7398|nr:hypothetical protein [Microbacterium sp. SORGH_AS_1204]MDQ1135397.1 hypothetical protein [Microbacterium sp. SORGH_AS_1204]
MSTNDDSLLSAAVMAFLGWPAAKMPLSDESAVADLARTNSVDANALLARVHDAVAASDDLTISDLGTHSDGGATAYKRRLAASRPALSSAAIDALASRWFFRLRWLGIESGQDAPRYFVRYGGEGATPIPIALYRRRTRDGVIVDEVLKDVDEWRPDTRRQIHTFFAFSLESDLEEVTATEAAEFEEMVRAREYVPFRSTAAPR